LNDIAGRAQGDWLTRFLADPHATKPGTTMPDVLAQLPAGERARAAEALAHHLLAASPGKAKLVFPDRSAVARGQKLYHTIGCVACHSPQDGSAAPADSVPTPVMAEKWTHDALRRFLRDPLAVRPSGRMPSLNLTDAEASDIAHYLLRETPVNAAVELIQFRGRPRSFDDFDTAEMARAVAHEGLTLGGMARDRGFSIRLSTYLRIDQPGDYTFHLDSAGSSRLSVAGNWVIGQESWRAERVNAKATVRLEAGTHPLLLDFVQRGNKEPTLLVEWQGPGLARGAIPADRLSARQKPPVTPPAFVVDPAKVALGKQYYASLNCAACHEAKPSQPALPALSALLTDRGCLSETPAARGAPDFNLAGGPRRDALRQALATLKPADLAAPSRQQQLAHAMHAMRCVQCHERDDVGKPPADRDAYFTSAGEDLGEEGRLPPRLTGVGDKLRAEAIAAALHQGAAVRPYLNTRMPQFGEANVKLLPELLVALDRKPIDLTKSDDPPDVQREVGRTLVGTDGLSCIACHKFNRQPGQTMQVVDLTLAPQRLNEDWFRRFLVDPNRFHPGTRMPSFWPEGRSLLPKLLDGNTARQHAALWAYLSDGPLAKFPPGMSRQNVELIVGGEAVVYRGKLWEAGFRGIAVGYPGGVNMAFDPEEMRLALLWRGRFLNAGPHWNVQGMGQIRPLGTDVVVFPKGPGMAVLSNAAAPWPKPPEQKLGMPFKGYQLDKQNRPTLLYAFGQTPIEDHSARIESHDGTTGLRRTITFQSSPQPGLHVRLAVGKLKSTGNDGWRLNDALTIRVRGAKAFVRGDGDTMELLVPADFGGKIGTLEVDYVW
jgi:mono/diheme cytochrome c family protein